MHGNIAMYFDSEEDFHDTLDAFLETRAFLKDSELVNLTTAKFFMDGVVEAHLMRSLLDYNVQSSGFSPSTRANSRVLFVTRVSPRAFA